MEKWKLWQQALVFFTAGVILTSIGFIVSSPPRGNGILLTPAVSKQLVVHIDGAVSKPGVYEFTPDTRVQDVVNKAGGLTSSARSEGLNLARFITDGEKITIPSNLVDTQSGGSSLLDLNTATISELDKLPGIGKVRAQAILDFRTNQGLFTSIEQLLLVEGITEDVYSGIKTLVTIQ